MKQLKIHLIQHLDFEGPGCIQDWINKKSHSTSYTYMYAGEQLPDVDDIDMLIVLGGAMNVDEDDKYPWLREEKRFIASCIAADMPVLGICLGSQLIVRALGGKVYPNNEKEIGWHPIQKAFSDKTHPLHFILPEVITCFHWHGDTYDLPIGGMHLYQSAGCYSQGFLYGGKVMALQFHPEANEGLVNAMLSHEGGELNEKGKYIQTEAEIRDGMRYSKKANEVMFVLLDYLANSVT